ncbi:hypothetical protein AKJ65_08250 [candidate division MSBL1 archaeon SCGC-AAA259E19]|uniref:Uncharacterized protein n=2 Tax=candidate division MSBL1 TaxID=215777 RepID=A0A133U6T0_9EURY|nr:hypothetical protein AKJ57_04760 [candidate division MSBL1 archaeon SCGC-AAA259A05]KXA91955.1 hypothetical protein AKJ65_08250 [candidate division MSBL1 archaeon SCGC-AAA259E19]
MNKGVILAIIIAAIASMVEAIGGYALATGLIDANPHALIMTFSGIAGMWIAIIIALSSRSH